MNTIDKLLSALKVSAKIFHNGQYCGNWQADTSGSGYMNFHIITHGHCYFHTNAGEIHRLEKGDMVLMPTDSGHYLSPVANDTPTGNTNNSTPVPASLTSEDPVLVCGYFVHQHPFAKILNQGLPEYLVVKKRNKAQHGMYTSMQLLMSESLNMHDSVQVNSVVLDKIAELIFVYVAKDMFSDNSALFQRCHTRNCPRVFRLCTTIRRTNGQSMSCLSMRLCPVLPMHRYLNRLRVSRLYSI